jgi:hypothetical protein
VHAEFLLCGLLNRSTSSLSGKGQFAADGEKIKGREAFIHPFISPRRMLKAALRER